MMDDGSGSEKSARSIGVTEAERSARARRGVGWTVEDWCRLAMNASRAKGEGDERSRAYEAADVEKWSGETEASATSGKAGGDNGSGSAGATCRRGETDSEFFITEAAASC